MAVLTPEEDQAFIAARKAATGRECGTCSLCCKLLNVPEVGKKNHEWCPHCRPGKGGCSIYETRPDICRGYGCVWLVNLNFNDDWFPQKCGIVGDVYGYGDNVPQVRFFVDPETPDCWREEPYYSKIKSIALQGLRGEIVAGAMVSTIVRIKGNSILVLPNKDIPNVLGIIVRTGEYDYELLPFEPDEPALAAQ
jgi:hypothetical protein